jgi:hypothetical protein
LATGLNKAINIIWPFVPRYRYEYLEEKYNIRCFELYETSRNLDELEEFQFNKGPRYVPFPDYKYSFKQQEILGERPVTRLSLSAEPMRAYYQVATYDLDFEDSSEYIKNLLVRQAGELFRKKGEADMRQVIESLSRNDDRKIY